MEPPPPVNICPAPWETKAETYWLALNLKAGVDTEKGVYAPLEAESPDTSDPQHVGKHGGGLGLIMIVRYSDTPCGPYDELMLIPGAFDVPGKPKKQLRMTRIYVSQKDTMYNGRVNWNTPKHLARFTFSAPPVSSSNPHPPSKLQISLYPPSPEAKIPFFSATLQPFTFPPAVPFRNSWLPSYFSKLAMPPLPSALSASAEAWVEDEEQAEAVLAAGTDDWCEFQVAVKTSKARGCWATLHSHAQGSSEEAEAEIWWPQGQAWKPLAVGLWMEEADLLVKEGVKWKN